MVFIHGKQVSPSIGRVKTKKASFFFFCVLPNLLVPIGGGLKIKEQLFSFSVLAGCIQPATYNLQFTTMRNLRLLRFHSFVALYCLIVFIHGTHVLPSSGRVKTKKASVQILASCRSCVLHSVLVATSINNFSQCVLYTNFLALYFMTVFIGENICGAI